MERVYREEMDGRLRRRGRGTWRGDRRRKGGKGWQKQSTSRTVGLNAERLLQLWLGDEWETVFRSAGRASHRHGDHFTRRLEEWSSRLGQALMGRVIQQKRRAGRRKDGGIAHSVKNDYHFSEREELKVNEHKIFKYILKKNKQKR